MQRAFIVPAQVAPLLWTLALALFLALGYANIRRTKRGYRYPLPLIALGAVLTSMALGFGLYASGAGGAIEAGIGDHPPFYRPIALEERSWWQGPERGVLGGEVLSVATGTSFSLKDFSGTVWQIDAADLRAPDIAALSVGTLVRVVGAPLATTTDQSFHACFVFLWETPPGVSQNTPRPLQLGDEITPGHERSDICKGIRPYGALHALHGE